jgi:ribonuclease HIII
VIEEWIKKTGAKIDLRRAIDYGEQFRLSRGTEQAIVNVYSGRKGTRVVVQGKGPLADEFGKLSDAEEAAKQTASQEFGAWCGSDEAGKGEYLGPLTVAAVALDKKSAVALGKLGVRDSKELTNAAVKFLDKRIRDEAEFRLVGWLPEEYNRRYDEARNINKLLGIAHTEAILGVVAKKPGLEAIVVDQFGDENYVKHGLLAAGCQIHLIQRPKADATDLAVAAASIVARAAFMRGIEKLERDLKVKLALGNNEEAMEAARRFVKTRGKEKLGLVAKLHFKTTATL